MADTELRQRATALRDDKHDKHEDDDGKDKEDVVWGRTPSGTVFRVPTTHDVVRALLHPRHPKSHLDILNITSLALQLLLFALLPPVPRKLFFFIYFAFWRACYDGGLGFVLTWQSKRRWIVREVVRRGWLDENRNPRVKEWIKNQLIHKMGSDYAFDSLPVEYNSWLLFRQLVDIILINDFLSYVLFALACFRIPSDLNAWMHVARVGLGGVLVAFNVWVKSEAHAVVTDYGWYWGDCFFARGALVFDGVFELAPHPMYTVGYAWLYGLALLAGSYPVLLTALAAHAAQFAFLALFENPHIERFYGQRRPLAERVPLKRSARPTRTNSENVVTDVVGRARADSAESDFMDGVGRTPSVTEGESATETELETETEDQDVQSTPRPSPPPGHPTKIYAPSLLRTTSNERLSEHDLANKYFRRDTIGLINFDLFRAQDLLLLLTLLYAALSPLTPLIPTEIMPGLLFAHALFWTGIHVVGLGLVLRAQSRSKFLTRHFLTHYHYPQRDAAGGAVREAFGSWKTAYNACLCMTFVSAGALTYATYAPPDSWTSGDALLRHLLGGALVALHAWVSRETYDVLGPFGWFYGDFFLDGWARELDYSGIYRYLNNPEILSGAAFFGLALVSGSKLVFALAGARTAAYWWFLRCVENPHMKKLYGAQLRREAGFQKVVGQAALARAVRRSRLVRTLDRAFDEAGEAIEEFIDRARPKLEEVVQDTRTLLQSGRERLVIARTASPSTLPTERYRIQADKRRYHLGEPIEVQWDAPMSHSRTDWVGIYRVGANASKLVTRTSSLGYWVPVHNAEWDGDVPIEPKGAEERTGNGKVVFRGKTLPWSVGTYEIRYHHDGKHNVLAHDGPLEIYAERPTTRDFASVRGALARVVPLCLDQDPRLVPLSTLPHSARLPTTADEETEEEKREREEREERDPDDFRFWDKAQAVRVSKASAAMFGLELAPAVVMADANLTALAHRIVAGLAVLNDGVEEE